VIEMLRRIADLPVRAGRGAWRFANPRLRAGRIPYARTVLALQLIGALIFVGYTLGKKQVALPFSPDPYLVDVVLPDAAGLDPAKEPTASVAGAQAGRVVEVRQQGGKAVATLRLEPEMRGRIFADATASLRPLNVLQVLNVNVLPGDPASGPLPEGEPIAGGNTDAFVHIDELTGMLDADTQAQVQVLISEAAIALRDREPELRATLAELGELTETATPIARELDRRRRLLERLVGHLDVVFTTVGRRGAQLGDAIEAGSRTLEVTAAREPELAAAVGELEPTLSEARAALLAGRRLASPLTAAADQLLPAAGNLGPAASGVRELIPSAAEFLELSDRLVREGRRPVRLFKQGTRRLPQRVRRDLIPAISNFGETIDALDKYKGGIAQTADLWSGAFSVNANHGPYSQIYFGNGELDPAGLGFGPAAARSRGDRPSRLSLMLADALERTCRESNPMACVFRFSLPELPDEPLPREAPAAGKGG
jgi:virulence factor Mce-like protein